MKANKQWTILEALSWTEQRLERSGEEHPRLAAQMLAAHATGLTRIELYTSFDKPLSENERTVLREAIQRRLACEPLQYIIGRTGFRYLELAVRPPVLIPRPETETLVELVLHYLSEATSPLILDIGTGTGAIALSLLHELPGCKLVATDIDPAALSLAELNAEQLGLEDAESDSLKLLHDDLASSLINNKTCHGTFDVLVSNPPYIPTEEYESLPAEIKQFESRGALDGGADGLDTFRRLAQQAVILLKPGGLLAVELHEDTLEEAAAFVRSLPYHEVRIHKDLTGRNRFLAALRNDP